jgi:hypothetical protein
VLTTDIITHPIPSGFVKLLLYRQIHTKLSGKTTGFVSDIFSGKFRDSVYCEKGSTEAPGILGVFFNYS